jgi:hypothetical protein
LESDFDSAWLSEELHRILPELCEIEGRFLTLRYGLTSGNPSTLNEIAAELHISISHIREIESHLQSLLRHPSRSKLMYEYLKEDIFKTSNYEQTGKIISRSPIHEIFTSNFEAFFEDIFTIDEDENTIYGIQLNTGYIDKYFESKYGRPFNLEEMYGESLYENLCKGYFSWSSEFDFLIELTFDKWISEDPAAYELNLKDPPMWMDKVGFAIALISSALDTEPLDLALNYMVSAPRENYLTGLLSFEARTMINLESIAQGFLSKKVEVNKALRTQISKASDQYASDYKNFNQDSESRILFYLADLISRVYWLGRWGCTFAYEEYVETSQDFNPDELGK